MPLLFSYGTLQQEEVQLSTFGRKLEGEKDLLLGYEPSLVKIRDGSVQGTVFEVTDDELAQADRFEAEFAYTRVTAALASGKEAWVYIHGT